MVLVLLASRTISPSPGTASGPEFSLGGVVMGGALEAVHPLVRICMSNPGFLDMPSPYCSLSVSSRAAVKKVFPSAGVWCG